jgi:hypothetical protein
MFQKYPMCLYQRGDAQADYVIVRNEDEEAALRAEGYAGAWEPQEKAQPEPEKRKPGRPRKAEQ